MTLGTVSIAIGVVALVMRDYGIGAFLVTGGSIGVALTVVGLRRERGSPDPEVSPTRLITGGALLIGLGAVFALRDASVGDLIWPLIGIALIVVGLVRRWRAPPE